MNKAFLKIHYAIAYLNYVILPVIPYIIHELSHYIVALLFWIFRLNSFPKIVILTKGKITHNKTNTGYAIDLWFMGVKYNSKNENSLAIKITTIAPLFTCSIIGYYAITNGILTSIIFLYNFHTLFLSMGDINSIFKSKQL